MGGYAVDPAQLQHVDALLGECVTQSRAALDGLAGAAHALLAAGWHGPAATDFRQGWHEWHDGARAAITALEELATAVGLSGRDYDATESTVRAAIARASP
jgi:WXG100 family type VII secretion target